jgi:tetratricopeptide (TPR) repeat protein
VPRLVILHPHGQGGEDESLKFLHVTSLAQLLALRGWDVVTGDILDPRLDRLVASAHVVLVQMLPDAEVEAIIRTRRERGLPTVYEIVDNFLAISDWGGDAHPLRSPLRRQAILLGATRADALQVYSHGLAEVFAGVNPRIIRFDPYSPLPDDVPPKPPGFVLGWAGTATNAADLAAVAPAITAFCHRHPDATFAYMGNQDVFRAHFGAIRPAQADVHPFSEHAKYRAFVGGLHVGLVPRLPTAFNAARTDWKFATYAAYGAAAVLEDAPAHRPHRERARLFRTADELHAVLEELHADPAFVARLGRTARDWVLATRSEKALADQRDAAYRALLHTGGAPSASPAPPPSGPAAHLAAAHRLPPADALASARELVDRDPAYEQAHLLVAVSLERLGRHEEALTYVERLAPSPLFSDSFAEVQVRCARSARPHAAAGHLRRIASAYRRARLAAGGGVLERARAVLEHQPYDHFALAAAIRLIERDQPDSPELAELYERASLVDPEEVPGEQRPARLAGFLPR